MFGEIFKLQLLLLSANNVLNTEDEHSTSTEVIGANFKYTMPSVDSSSRSLSSVITYSSLVKMLEIRFNVCNP